MVPSLLLLAFLFSSIHGLIPNCPPQETIGPKCSCKKLPDGPTMLCNNIDPDNPTELWVSIRETKDYRISTLSIHNSDFISIPDGVFKKTHFKKIRLVECDLLALAETDFAFEGLEDVLEEFRVVSHFFNAGEWSWSQLRNLRRLELIDLEGASLEGIAEPFPPLQSLSTLNIRKAFVFSIVEGAFKELKNLKRLSLKDNAIKELQRNMFPDPADKLEYLDLSNNQLETLPSDIIRDMPSLVDLLLANNRFKTLQEGVFSQILRNVENLSLAGNRLICNCLMSWIVDVHKPYRLEAVCVYPESVKGRDLKELGAKDLEC